MRLQAVTERYWIFENFFGGFVEVKRSKHPELFQAKIEARRITTGG